MPLPERKLHRLKSWDYAQAGYYFVTVCTQNKKPILSHLHQQGMDVVAVPSKIGQVVINCWQEMNSVSPYVRTDAFCLCQIISTESLSLRNRIAQFAPLLASWSVDSNLPLPVNTMHSPHRNIKTIYGKAHFMMRLSETKKCYTIFADTF